MSRYSKISSRENSKIKFVKAVRDGREKDVIFVEGLRLCEELLKTEINLQYAFFQNEFLENERGINLLNKIEEKNTEIIEIDTRIFDSLSDTKTSQGIILIADKPKVGKDIISNNLSENPFLVLLHQVNNPANLGAILRTTEAAGIEAVITTKGTTDVFSPKSLRSSMGANFRLPFWTNADFFDALNWAKSSGIQSVCADIRSQKSYLEIDWKVPRLLIVGSEGHGLTDIEMSATDENLVIPMTNNVESLNVAVACGIVLFEAKRQRNQ